MGWGGVGKAKSSPQSTHARAYDTIQYTRRKLHSVLVYIPVWYVSDLYLIDINYEKVIQ